MIIVEDANKELLRNNKETTSKRNYGIDLLKMIAMINIINLHINRYSLNLRLHPNHPKYKQIHRLQIISYWPVNAFGIISGLISFKKYKFSNLFYLWFEYFFYSVFFSVYLYMRSLLNLKLLIFSFFPIAIKRYWYANAYFYLYLFLPFLTNSFITLDKNAFTKFIGIYLFFYSFYHKLIEYNIGETNFDFINRGYSSIWLIILYIIGCYLGRFYMHNKLIPNSTFFIIYLLSSFITSEYTFYTYRKNKFINSILISYNSPTIIIQAISLIFLFYNLKIKNKYIQKIILFFYPLNFNIALIHLRIFEFKTQTIAKFFNYINKLEKDFIFFKIYGISIIIYFICAFFDYLRFILFKIINIRNFCIFIEKKIFK